MEEMEIKRQRRGPYLPLERRVRAFNQVLRLHGQGLKCKEIIEAIDGLEGVKVSRNTISDWVNEKHQPLGKVNEFDAKPSPTLAYIIGVRVGDGYLHNYGYSHAFELAVTDKDFATEAGRRLARLVGRNKPYEAWWGRSDSRWHIKCCSILFYQFLNQPWQIERPYIEHCKDCVAAFLRGFFDSEGSITGRTLTVTNTNKLLLLYVRRLLQQYFGIESTGPHRRTKKGQEFRSPNNGKIYKRKKACYYLRIRSGSLPLFYRYIGSTIKRKHRRLIETIQK